MIIRNNEKENVMAENVTATWTVELNCVCPGCNKPVDLLDYPDFWVDGRNLDVAEHNTDLSRNLEVICPACHHEFKVDCEY